MAGSRTPTRTTVPYAKGATRASGQQEAKPERETVTEGATELVVPLTAQRATLNFTIYDAAQTAPIIISRQGIYLPNALDFIGDDDVIEVVFRRRAKPKLRPARKAATGTAKRLSADVKPSGARAKA
jgi:hypothetical protein